jgi:hypothetical protein
MVGALGCGEAGVPQPTCMIGLEAAIALVNVFGSTLPGLMPHGLPGQLSAPYPALVTRGTRASRAEAAEKGSQIC